MVMMFTMKPKNLVSFIVSHPLNEFNATFATHSQLLPFRNPSSFLQSGTGTLTPKTISAPFHSMSLSNGQTLANHPRSVSEKITNLNDALQLQLFDEMTQRQPLPSVVKFNQLLPK
ncbi:hypothetical protein Lser_V15G13646 [Lactuca serriola]